MLTKRRIKAMDKEIEAMGIISTALNKIEDQQTVSRILNWAIEKYQVTKRTQQSFQPQSKNLTVAMEQQPNSLNDICMLTPSGDFKITVRDLKAKNGIDAAMRLALIAIYCHKRLTGEEWTSSRNIVTPALKNYRLYSGNSRTALGKHKGVIRDGDALTLDMHAEAEAEEYIAEIRDPSATGQWNPNTPSAKKKVKKKSISKGKNNEQ